MNYDHEEEDEPIFHRSPVTIDNGYRPRHLNDEACIGKKQYKSSCLGVCFDFLIHYFDEFFWFLKILDLKKRVLKNPVKLNMVKNQNKLANRAIYTAFYQSMQ